MGKAIARINKDICGGKLITPPNQSTVFCNNYPIAILGQAVNPHYPCGQPGGTPHCNATIIISSKTVFINNKGVVRKGDSASCGHSVSSGSGNVFAN